MSANFTPNYKEYKNLPPFKGMILQNFPFIEEDFDAITNYQLLCKVVEYLKNVIANEELVEENVTNLYNAYVSLQNYVNTYFADLDVQEEINNKLDEMASDGSLYNIIEQYTQPIIEEQNTRITRVENELSSIANGSPLVASSMDEMTNTSKIYVLSTTGHWFWYDGTEWVDGGLYQSVQNDEYSIKYMMLENSIQKNMIAETIETSNYTNNGYVYTGNVGDTINTSNLENGYSGVMNVEAGDTIIVPFASQLSFTPDALIFTDLNNIIISKISKATINTSIINNGVIYKTIVPRNATKLYFNNVLTRDLTYYPFKITKFSFIDERLTDNINKLEKINIDTTLENKIYSLYSFNYTANNFKTEIYNVYPLEKIRIETIIPANNQFVPAIFFDEDGKPVGLYNQRGGSNPTPTQFDMIVPANATKLYICTASDTTNKVYKYTISDKYLIDADYNDNILTLTNNINGNYIKFKNFGGNNLFMIDSYKVGNTVINTHTDMIPAPYYVKAINNIDGDNISKTFTGGNHQYNNQASGSTPTARQISLNIYADNNILLNNSHVKCNKITIIETNRIQGYNTKKSDGSGREILEEKIIFKFDGTKLDVINTITPLEEILIERYYGIQTALFSNNDYKIYADKIYNYTNQNNVLKKPSIIFGNNIISSKLFNEGLGDYRYNNSATKVIIASQKSYYVPIYDNTHNFNTNDINYIRGEYIFENNQI